MTDDDKIKWPILLPPPRTSPSPGAYRIRLDDVDPPPPQRVVTLEPGVTLRLPFVDVFAVDIEPGPVFDSYTYRIQARVHHRDTGRTTTVNLIETHHADVPAATVAHGMLHALWAHELRELFRTPDGGFVFGDPHAGEGRSVK